MKNLLLTIKITVLCVALHAQTPYYYYYEGEKQYLELNTEYAFLSLKEHNMPDDILQRNITYTELKSDNSNKKHFQENNASSRFYTRLSFNENLTEEQYWALLCDMKQKNKDIIIAPFFKTHLSNSIGLSNFFYVRLKDEKDISILVQMAEKN